jgi:hypothetical protein
MNRYERTPKETRVGAVYAPGDPDGEHKFADTNRHLVEVPDSFAIARWPRNADVTTIARCILGTLKYEPRAADTTALRRALQCVIEQDAMTAPTKEAQDA